MQKVETIEYNYILPLGQNSIHFSKIFDILAEMIKQYDIPATMFGY